MDLYSINPVHFDGCLFHRSFGDQNTTRSHDVPHDPTMCLTPSPLLLVVIALHRDVHQINALPVQKIEDIP